MFQKSKTLRFALIVAILLPLSFVSPTVVQADHQLQGSNTKIGFSWINSVAGISELAAMGYQKAAEMGCQIEHRDYSWTLLDANYIQLYEWVQVFLAQYPDIDVSLTLSVIMGGYLTIPGNFSIEPYTEINENMTRINDPRLVSGLKLYTEFIYNLTAHRIDYISFGSEINSFFEQFYNYTTKEFENTVMLEDYVDLCEQMYDYIKANHTQTKVLTIFRYQTEYDMDIVYDMVNDFDSACDIIGVSPRVFTSNYGYLERLNYEEVKTRFEFIADHAYPKKIAITNTYVISDKRAGGSELYQAAYVRYLFDTIDVLGDDLEFACWYRVFDFPPGYLGMLVNPYLEVHATAGLLNAAGQSKYSYHIWMEEMSIRGRIPTYYAPWKIAIGVVGLTVIVGFLVFAFVMEGIETYKNKDDEEKLPKDVTFGVTDDEESTTKKKKKKKKRKAKPKALEKTEDDKLELDL
ncbi:MAG: hypothetical protein ACTSO7_05915 [Candidatus Heimdallarchaeota archaeon]